MKINLFVREDVRPKGTKWKKFWIQIESNLRLFTISAYLIKYKSHVLAPTLFFFGWVCKKLVSFKISVDSSHGEAVKRAIIAHRVVRSITPYLF